MRGGTESRREELLVCHRGVGAPGKMRSYIWFLPRSLLEAARPHLAAVFEDICIFFNVFDNRLTNGKLCAQVVVRELLAQYTKQCQERPLASWLRSWAESGGDNLRTRYVTAQAITISGPQCLTVEFESTEPCHGTAHSCLKCLMFDMHKNTHTCKTNARILTPQLKTKTR